VFEPGKPKRISSSGWAWRGQVLTGE
jgi:hypothetical protein